MSYDELLESEIIYDIAEDNADEYPLDAIVAIVHRQPKSEGVTVWSTNATRRSLQRR
jgi:hypothetical protein